jgi:lysophospholipid acyltransferase (LPLAT)-like uncharacterized protein
MLSGIKDMITLRPMGFLLYHLVRSYCRTFRIRVENEQGWLDHLERGGAVLLCAWHQQFFPAIRHFERYRGYRPGIMISQSRDGEIVADVAKRVGWFPVRGSSSKGGPRAMRLVIEALKKSGLAAHIVDGPRGPAGRIKAGVIRIAHGTGAVIVPFYTSADRAWYFNSWDRFMLPKPFARVTLRFGEMVRFEPAASEEEFEKQRRHLEGIMAPELRTAPPAGRDS